MIEDRADSKGKAKLAVRKMHNSRTGHSSGFTLEFSATEWNQTTLDYFDSVKQLSSVRLTAIFDQAKGLATKGVPNSMVQSGRSGRAALQSDGESEGSESINLLATYD